MDIQQLHDYEEKLNDVLCALGTLTALVNYSQLPLDCPVRLAIDQADRIASNYFDALISAKNQLPCQSFATRCTLS